MIEPEGDKAVGGAGAPVSGAGVEGARGAVRQGEPARALSVHDFLTDGSLPGLCDALSLITGCPIWLRDREGKVIASGEGEAAWRVLSAAEGIGRAGSLVGRRVEAGEEMFAAPVTISAGTLGELVTPSSGAGEAVREALLRLAAAMAEACEALLSQRRRLRELDALYRLSSLLAQAGNVDRLLTIALDLAVEVLSADAGSLAIIEEGSEALTIKAARGLSRGWVSANPRLSQGGVLRSEALEGKVVCVEDMAGDPRVLYHDRVRREGLASLISTGLLYHGRPIGLLRLYTRRARRFTHTDRDLLRSIAEQSAAAVANARLRRLREEHERVERQVRLAADVQRRMLSSSPPRVAPFDVSAHYTPSFELGGDFYDFLDVNGSLGVVVGDVVGKGVAAALLMSAVRASLRAHAQDVRDIDEVLARVNSALVADTRDDEFATMWYGVADPLTLTLSYCAAGHEWPILVRCRGWRAPGEEELSRLTADGMALGVDGSQRYSHGSFRLEPGDAIVAYTDGLTDATAFDGRRFGGTAVRRAVLDVLREEPRASAARIVQHVIWSLRQFTGLAPRTDDVTVVALRVGDSGGAAV